MKRIISFLISIMLLVVSLPIITLAQETDGIYTLEQIESIWTKYKQQENMLNTLFMNDSGVGYWNMVNNIESNKTMKWLLEKSSMLIKEYPDKKDYAEILANLMTMQSGNLAQQIEKQSQFDDLHEGGDYVLDVIDIASSFVGGSGLLENISPIIDAGTGGLDVTVESVEQAKYYELVVKDYAQSYNFLKAISRYAEDKELRKVAKSLLTANDTLLQKRLEYLGDTLKTLGEYEAEFWAENIFFNALKGTDIYNEDDTVKWFVDCGEKMQKSILTTIAQGEFVFQMMMLIGNVGFGTNNTFNRYQEMRVLSQIAEALSEANSKVKVSADYEEGVIEEIQTKCGYYKSLIVTHARGEYLVYQLLIKDAGLISQFRDLFDMFKAPEDTTEGWYNNQIEVLTTYAEIIDDMFTTTEEKYVPLSRIGYALMDYGDFTEKYEMYDTYKYDELGNLIEVESLEISDDSVSKYGYEYRYEYDEEMNKIEKRYFFNGEIPNEEYPDKEHVKQAGYNYEFRYNKDGELIEDKSIDSETGEVSFKTEYTYEYDEKEKIIRTTVYDAEEISYITEYKYDDQGYVIESVNIVNNGWELSGYKYEHEYDNRGNLIKTVSYEEDGYSSTREYEYDIRDNVTKMTIYDSNGREIQKYEYIYGYITISAENRENQGDWWKYNPIISY